MPLVLVAYVLIEALAYVGVAQLLGWGWAFLALVAVMALGGAAAGLSLRGVLARAAHGQGSIGQVAGDTALLAAGWALCVVPGYVTSILGVALVAGPTRGAIRRILTTRVKDTVEHFGARVYSASPAGQQHTSYGTFRSEPGVIDATELERWYHADSAGDQDRRPGESS
ncbi:phage T7 F exclusion suppressor FxsA [Corynebacterium capitovis DSM 44611]|uniref:FxsA family protein n=1 Tax=Corynebacterium capitovis TaxID=131081 RepID=UPI00037DDB10|nr:FxsA family protein [Corynebacterium capitovis]WKD57687.1 phage T7 F exclusion suppressor FxsA [Corynebacterium capitovis DSM 44611]